MGGLDGSLARERALGPTWVFLQDRIQATPHTSEFDRDSGNLDRSAVLLIEVVE